MNMDRANQSIIRIVSLGNDVIVSNTGYVISELRRYGIREDRNMGIHKYRNTGE